MRPFPDVGSGKWQISSGGGTVPVWHPSEQELFFVGADRLMSVAFETESGFTPGAVTALFEIGSYALTGNRRLAVAPDGDRFLLLKETGQPEDRVESSREITVVLNWFEELKGRVPAP